MDFILSLTHFCEVHGPTSILCSQVIPSSCAQCYPDTYDMSPSDTPLSSHAASPALHSRGPDRTGKSDGQSITPPDIGVSTSLNGCSSSSLDPLPSPLGSAPTSSQRIEDHPWFSHRLSGRTETDRLSRIARADNETCASCSLTVPKGVSEQLPPGGPGTLKADGKGRNGSPVLRSREIVYSCSGSRSDYDAEPHPHHSPGTSLHSSASSETSSCHTHIVNYLSLHGPPIPDDYALLRSASIRTLSCELLPRGLSSGPLSFGDPVTGYTIAYVFRLPDPMARGKRRSYALLALAGKDAGRAFRASPLIWRVFGRIAASIVSAAERHQESEKCKEEGGIPTSAAAAATTSMANGRNYTPISSFLTGRALGPDGQPRRAGQIRARNLAEIVGNEYIFAELHAQFVALLQQLCAMFGGARIPDDRSVSSSFEEESTFSPRRQSLSGDCGRGTIDTGMTTARTSGSPADPGNPRHDYDSSSVMLSPAPKPIPISHRGRQVAA
ncbi:folliculin [Histoplasma capsulatum var. duboisii H88]|nr:folliculin [Histoplasma capsulatum]QSS51262.1 folliculin [Histoplasma capsulatum var. duboisii H88]QSS69266.1 folliculin [Histoplasma capsulatum G186AR]